MQGTIHLFGEIRRKHDVKGKKTKTAKGTEGQGTKTIGKRRHPKRVCWVEKPLSTEITRR